MFRLEILVCCYCWQPSAIFTIYHLSLVKFCALPCFNTPQISQIRFTKARTNIYRSVRFDKPLLATLRYLDLTNKDIHLNMRNIILISFTQFQFDELNICHIHEIHVHFKMIILKREQMFLNYTLNLKWWNYHWVRKSKKLRNLLLSSISKRQRCI